jgi:hypothetical protein
MKNVSQSDLFRILVTQARRANRVNASIKDPMAKIWIPALNTLMMFEKNNKRCLSSVDRINTALEWLKGYHFSLYDLIDVIKSASGQVLSQQVVYQILQRKNIKIKTVKKGLFARVGSQRRTVYKTL